MGPQDATASVDRRPCGTATTSRSRVGGVEVECAGGISPIAGGPTGTSKMRNGGRSTNERLLPEPAAEALHAGDADAAQLARIAVEDDNSGVGEDLADLIGLARFEIV